MRTALLILLAFAVHGIASTAWGATVWKWVDAKGQTHYSDQPVPGATRIEVRAGNVAETPSPTAPSPAADDAGARPAAPAASYSTFEIWRPDNEQVIPNSGGQVNVEIRIEPAVQNPYNLSLYLDGALVQGFPRNTLSYALSGVTRGTHSLIAVVTDQHGERVQETRPVVFTVRQESIANPPVGPSQKPPPKPPRPRGASNKMPTTQPSYGALNGGLPTIDPATNRPVVKKPAPKPGKP